MTTALHPGIFLPGFAIAGLLAATLLMVTLPPGTVVIAG